MNRKHESSVIMTRGFFYVRSNRDNGGGSVMMGPGICENEELVAYDVSHLKR